MSNCLDAMVNKAEIAVWASAVGTATGALVGEQNGSSHGSSWSDR